MLDRAAARENTKLVLVETLLLPVTPEQNGWLEDLLAKVTVVRTLAAEYGTALLPAHDFMTEAATIYGPEALAPDGVHLSKQGHQILADEWFELML